MSDSRRLSQRLVSRSYSCWAMTAAFSAPTDTPKTRSQRKPCTSRRTFSAPTWKAPLPPPPESTSVAGRSFMAYLAGGRASRTGKPALTHQREEIRTRPAFQNRPGAQARCPAVGPGLARASAFGGPHRAHEALGREQVRALELSGCLDPD